MTATVRAVYQGGVFRPTEPQPLADGTAVELAVTPVSPEYQAALDRITAAQTLDELWAAADAAAAFELDDGYDLLEALNRNRLEAGEAPLIPPVSGDAA